MTEFGEEYAHVYDTLYFDKDYEKECDFLESLFNKYGIKPKTILDLGCGTGGHALILAKRGYEVTGVDKSLEMLKIAKEKAANAKIEIEFINGDITKIAINKKFDVVIAMFAVMSYQTTNDAVSAVCKLAKNAKIPRGLFIFDCWFGPAVLIQKPTDRIKEIILPTGVKIIRFAHPEIDIIKHIVKVNYRLWQIKPSCNLEPSSDQIYPKSFPKQDHVELLSESHPDSSSQLRETFETHTMRFFFPQEIKYFLESAGFKQIDFYPFLELDKHLNETYWNITVVGL